MLKSHIPYSVILSQDSLARIEAYGAALQAGAKSGARLRNCLEDMPVAGLDKWQLLSALLNSKRPQIFAESAIMGDGSDWTLGELQMLGDISIAMTVSIYDNGAHQNPVVHAAPFTGHLIYTPGALLRNDRGEAPADWDAVTVNGSFDKDKYNALYERRLLPAFKYISQSAVHRGRPAFVTLPGMGAGQFAGPFRGQMGHLLQAALMRLLRSHGDTLPGIKAVYYDPYNECINEARKISGIDFIVRPLTAGNPGKSQLCQPSFLAHDIPGDFEECELYSFVAWDHASWPGNDYYLGARVTDDGVKAAATNTMQVMTGIKGSYAPDRYQYEPPEPYGNWNEVVIQNNLQIRAQDNVFVG